MEPFIRPNIPALTRHRLSWTRQNYLRAETLVKANAKLVDYQVNSSSGTEMGWRRSGLSGWHEVYCTGTDSTRRAEPKIFWFRPRAHLVQLYFRSVFQISWHCRSCTLRDSIFVLEGLLEQQTGLNPTEIMTDTAGSSDLIFGLFWLLGYQFSPRLADAGASVFWRTDKDAA
ncbi:transposase [Escherichia coli]|uniref:Tn3 family transposase n=1 Tax=Escherichia coli TaxID=562 RepID=UPI001993293E|nr:hypothetical protein [Escherichia coli]CAD5562795.1 transposase [Escherichia coli]CAD5878267.1 transposase [Escherichia coli]